MRSQKPYGLWVFKTIGIALLLTALHAGAQTKLVKDPGELKQAVAKASPGDVIHLANGEWKDAELIAHGKGTEQKPVVIAAESPGGVTITGNSVLKIAGEYLVIKGLHFKNGTAPDKEVISFRRDSKTLANHCRLTEIVIENFSPADKTKNDNWVALYGKNNRVDHCTFVNKTNLGPTLVVKLDDERSRENFHSIDSNYFKGRDPLGVNGGETIRIGVSQESLSSSKTLVRHNYFERCNGEVEIISIKSCENHISFNTFFECEGGLVLRHGNNNTIEGNLFLGNNKPLTGGVRVINAGHNVFNNVFKDLAGDEFHSALSVMNGVPNSPANRYHQVKNVDIHHNTFINCKRIAFGLGKDDERTLPPDNVQFRNNLFYAIKDEFYRNNNPGKGILFANNLVINGVTRNLPSGFKFSKSNVEKISRHELLLPVNGTGADVSALSFTERESTGASWFTHAEGKNEKKKMSHATLRMPEVFSDNMVLQRDKPIVVWGWAAPQASVTVELDNERVSTTTSAEGKWMTRLPAKSAGGPFTLTITSNSRIAFSNIMIGEVWLLSGQSNMGWKVSQSNNAEKELADSTFPNIRLLTIGRAMGNIPQGDVKTSGWQACTSTLAADFSAIGFFFGRTLHKDLNVPVGLIHSSWGGTNIEAWMSREALDTISAFKNSLDSLPHMDLKSMSAKGNAERKAWLKEMEETDLGKSKQWHTLKDFSGWEEIELPAVWEHTKLNEIDGIIWVGKLIDLTGDEAKSEIEIGLGRIDNEDITYINGIEVGASTNKDLVRKYVVSPGIFETGTNVITIRTKDTGSIGGFRSSGEKLCLKTKTRTIPLAGKWFYAPGTPGLLPAPKEVHPNDHATVLYNGMINPLIHFGLKGILWYQGESNTSRSQEYRSLFPAMINDWRNKTGNDVTFLFVQLANYKSEKKSPGRSDWAELREAQQLALQKPNTGMAIAIDIGEADDIHPKNKQEVARRLVLLAKNKCYGEKLKAESPMYERMEISGNQIRIYFLTGGSKLKSSDGSAVLKAFAIAGDDQKFVWAEAKIVQQNTVVVHHPEITKPVAVRYAWADNPGALNLINTEGLPAAPFRTDNWELKVKVVP